MPTGIFWRLADVADGYWRRHYGQRDRPGSRGDRAGGWDDLLRPVAVGDVVCCYARCVKRGNTSVTINIEVWVKKFLQNRLASATRRRRRCLSTLPLIIRKTTSSASGIRRCPACRAPDLQKAQQRKEEVTDDNHDHRQHVQWEILHQDRMARYHNAFSELLAG